FFVRLRGRLAVHVGFLVGCIDEVHFAAGEILQPNGAGFVLDRVVATTIFERVLNPMQGFFYSRTNLARRLPERWPREQSDKQHSSIASHGLSPLPLVMTCLC